MSCCGNKNNTFVVRTEASSCGGIRGGSGCSSGQSCIKQYYNNGVQHNSCYTTSKFVRPRYSVAPVNQVVVTPLNVTPIYTLGTNTAGIFGSAFCGNSPGGCYRRYSTLYGGSCACAIPSRGCCG